VPLDLGEGLADEIESPEFATVAGLIRGIPGGKSSEYQSLLNVRRRKKKIKEIVKKVQGFFDEL
jgi:cell division protein FtsA